MDRKGHADPCTPDTPRPALRRQEERLLTRAGFTAAEARLLDAPAPGHIGTLIVRAEAT
ncbi:hypothetical protein [Streptomyces turgidiscabies]|uniref:Methyltransferase n=1 Tax=Streptomyces turgidiscabies TaxID=85558 RepID=A0ABU0RS81_9ACTN|nr:hypothetical protein [Streptomyces turgidiscabies]MDQ0934573.1 hypothetical protein [Streptomyces turgidiscabies]